MFLLFFFSSAALKKTFTCFWSCLPPRSPQPVLRSVMFLPFKEKQVVWSEGKLFKELSDFIGKTLVSELICVHSYRPDPGPQSGLEILRYGPTLVVRSMLVSLLLKGTSDMFIFKALLTSSSPTNQGWHVTDLTYMPQWNSLTLTQMRPYVQPTTPAHTQTQTNSLSQSLVALVLAFTLDFTCQALKKHYKSSPFEWWREKE